ncbi:hypothetical protein [Streptomyces sp. V3I7]|uniref:hypothetical protein n=1 Tax=Streptomyces sp. V3I7 TaxID=3042278 RepID=UPI0027843997|nr:hypothetical protein [Streptomyces sp. V3I7]MDQ0992648.1 hypothetical protein [Streptomyces sp. V3I7]
MDIRPWTGVDMAQFGDSRTVLRSRIGGELSTFRRTPGDPPIDHYVDVGLLLSFDAYDRLCFMEITKPSEPLFAGVVLLGQSFGDIVSALRRNGVEVEIDDSGCTLVGHGIALYTPAPDEPDVEVEGVAVFSVSDEGPKESVDIGKEPELPGDTLF